MAHIVQRKNRFYVVAYDGIDPLTGRERRRWYGGLPRVMIWVERTPEGLAGLLRHELEHTVQIAAQVELHHLHQRAFAQNRIPRQSRLLAQTPRSRAFSN